MSFWKNISVKRKLVILVVCVVFFFCYVQIMHSR